MPRLACFAPAAAFVTAWARARALSPAPGAGAGPAGVRLADAVNLGVIGVYNNRTFRSPDEDDDEPPMTASTTPRACPASTRATRSPRRLLDLRVDARVPLGATASGVYLHVFGGGAPPQNGFGFIHYAAEIAVFIDLYRRNRVLVLRAAHEGVWGDEEDIPFADRPRLGGSRRLRGYDLHRFRDKTTGLVTGSSSGPSTSTSPAPSSWTGGASGAITRSSSSPRTAGSAAEAASSSAPGSPSSSASRSRTARASTSSFTTDPLVAFEGRTEQR